MKSSDCVLTSPSCLEDVFFDTSQIPFTGGLKNTPPEK